MSLMPGVTASTAPPRIVAAANDFSWTLGGYISNRGVRTFHFEMSSKTIQVKSVPCDDGFDVCSAESDRAVRRTNPDM